MHQGNASYPVKRTRHFVSRQLQKHLQAFAGVDIVVDEHNANMHSEQRKPGIRAATGFRGVTIHKWRRNEEFAAFTRPRLFAVTNPPCISTIPRTILSPMLSPPSARRISRHFAVVTQVAPSTRRTIGSICVGAML
jgi:hypothetical protein